MFIVNEEHAAVARFFPRKPVANVERAAEKVARYFPYGLSMEPHPDGTYTFYLPGMAAPHAEVARAVPEALAVAGFGGGFGDIGSRVVSAGKLSKALKDTGLWPRVFTANDLKKHTEAAKGVGHEIFGKKAMIFIHARDMEHRKAIERFLRREDYRFDPRYWPGAPVVEAQVSYFKGWHWDE